MKQKDLLEKYLKTLYEFYKKNNFEEFVNFCYSYNIRIGDYRKNISRISKNIFNSILALLSENKAKFTYIETNKYYKINIIYLLQNFPTPKITITVPLFEENYEKITLFLTKYLVNEKVNIIFKLSKIEKNSILEIKVDETKTAKQIVDLFIKDENLKNETLSRVMPFIPQINLIGITYDYKPYNYNSFYIQYLYEFFSKIQDIENVNIDSLQTYFENKYKIEKKLNKKRMFLAVYRSIYIINNEENIFNLFEYNSELNIGSINPNEYDLKIDSNNMIYFKNKDDEDIIISFGSEDYLNLTYSKFYENVMKKEKNYIYYNYFNNIYSKILSDNYENFEKYLNFSSINKDTTYQFMMLISSGFFAYRKLNFTLESINDILAQVIFKNFNIKLKTNKNEEFIANKKIIFNFPLDIDFGNKVVDTKKGDKTTIKEYFKDYKVLDSIPIDSKVYLKNGKVETGEEFLYKIHFYIDKYDDFQALLLDMVNLIEFK